MKLQKLQGNGVSQAQGIEVLTQKGHKGPNLPPINFMSLTLVGPSPRMRNDIPGEVVFMSCLCSVKLVVSSCFAVIKVWQLQMHVFISKNSKSTVAALLFVCGLRDLGFCTPQSALSLLK